MLAALLLNLDFVAPPPPVEVPRAAPGAKRRYVRDTTEQENLERVRKHLKEIEARKNPPKPAAKANVVDLPRPSTPANNAVISKQASDANAAALLAKTQQQAIDDSEAVAVFMLMALM